MNTISLKYFISELGSLEDFSTLKAVREIYKDTKSYEDETITLDINGNTIKKYRNFYEIFIDNKPLSFILDEYFENTTPIIYNWVGQLGAFSKKIDLILIKLLLKKEIEKIDVINLFNRENKKLTPSTIKEIELESGCYIEEDFKNFKNEEIHIYASYYGELYHGGYFVTIKKETGYYEWIFTTKHKIGCNIPYKPKKKDKLIFKFEEKEYKKTMYNYLNMKKIKLI